MNRLEYEYMEDMTADYFRTWAMKVLDEKERAQADAQGYTIVEEENKKLEDMPKGTVKEIAQVVVDAISQDDFYNEFWGETSDYNLERVSFDGHFNMIEVVKKLQALGIIGSSEDNG